MTREEAIAYGKRVIDLGLNDETQAFCEMAIEALEQEPRCKDCKWWKDSDGKYRRGIGAESQCPLNTHVVYCGDGYCYMFSPKAESEG